MFFSKRKKAKKLELVYKISAGIPFKWEFEIKDKDIVEFVKSYVVRDDNKGALVGAHVYTKYIFKGIKEGNTTISFRLVSITGEHGIQNEDKYMVMVDKNMNISLINNN